MADADNSVWTEEILDLQEIWDGRDASPGSIVDGRFLLVEAVGHGGMSTVYRALDRQTGATVAVKVARPGSGLARRRESLRAELLTFERLKGHPNFPVVIASGGLSEGRALSYLCLEYAHRGSVAGLLKDRGPLSLEFSVRIALQVLYALQAAHDEGIVHRDVKPANILLADEGRAMLTDFGVVKSADQTLHPAQGSVMGTVSFMAPEQVCSPDDVDGRADLYSVGASLYAMLTCRSPFGMSGDAYRLSSLPEPLRPIVGRTTAPLPEDRYPTALAMARELAPFAGGSQFRVSSFQSYAGTTLESWINGGWEAGDGSRELGMTTYTKKLCRRIYAKVGRMGLPEVDGLLRGAEDLPKWITWNVGSCTALLEDKTRSSLERRRYKLMS